jgi:lauroyl/myristoyl acyltransferase
VSQQHDRSAAHLPHSSADEDRASRVTKDTDAPLPHAPAIALAGHKIVETKDLYRLPVWVGRKVLYTVLPVPHLFRLARAKGRIVWFIPARRRRVLSRLERFFGETKDDADLRRIGQRHLEYIARRQLARVWPEIRGFSGHESCRVEGIEHLDAALAAGKGAILATMHFGYLGLIKPLLRARGYTVWFVGYTGTGRRVPRSTRLGLFVHTRLLRLPLVSRPELRSPDAGVFADLQAGINLRPLLAALNANDVLVVALDTSGHHARERPGSVRPIPVHGTNVLFAPGAMSMARTLDAPVLPTFVVDSNDGSAIGIRLEICPPLALRQSNRRREDLDTGLERFAAVFEAYLGKYPHLFHCDGAGTIAELRVGDRVKVKGRLGEDGIFVALAVKIRPAASGTRTRLRGAIERVDERSKVIRVLDRDIPVPAACRVADHTGKRISLGDVAVGRMLELTGTSPAQGRFVPSRIRLWPDDWDALEGTVQSVDANGRTFQVLGFTVATTEATKVKDRTGRVTRVGRSDDGE